MDPTSWTYSAKMLATLQYLKNAFFHRLAKLLRKIFF